MSLYKEIARLVEYGLRTELVAQADKRYMINQLLEVFHEDEYEEQDVAGEDIVLPEVLDTLTDIAFERGIISSDDIVTRDLFDTKLMGILTPRPVPRSSRSSRISMEKNRRRRQMHFIKFSQDTNYIRRDRIKKDIRWKVDSPYGKIDITINLSKPEKDPKAIAAAKNAPQSAYPKLSALHGERGNMPEE